MSMTMSQKILAAHAGKSEVHAGELVMAKLDLILGNDITAPVAIPICLPQFHVCCEVVATLLLR